jgi:AcrR family transcriptional regulator
MASRAPVSNTETSTRERILEAALNLFSQYGYAGTTVRQLARAVGLRESSLYNHFLNKEAIYAALMDVYGPARSASRLTAPRYEALRRNPEEFCRLYAAELLDQWSDPREQRFQDLITTERLRLPKERTLYREALFVREQNLVTRYFTGFAASGLIYAPTPKEAARLFMAGLTFIRLEHFTMPIEVSDRPTVRQALDEFLASFMALTAVKRPDAPGP